jgi:hypothetical protein
VPTRRARGADAERGQQLGILRRGRPQERDIEAESRSDREPRAGNPLVLEVEANLGDSPAPGSCTRARRARDRPRSPSLRRSDSPSTYGTGVVGQPVSGARVEQRQDVDMLELSGDLDFPQEALRTQRPGEFGV